jgi:hypothetical protein
VLLAGLEEGVWPNWQAEQHGVVAEEHWLSYVGVPRARNSLQLSWMRHRRDWAGKPPRFLAEIPRALVEGAAAALRSVDHGGLGSAPARAVRSVKPPTQAETDRLVAEFTARKAVEAAR